MQRPPIACQRAVQSFQSSSTPHIWISDDQLSIAVNRFFCTPCPYQKRHGSNVPGPLEARRRAAKRRMTISAGFYPQDNFPPAFSLRALFGVRKNPQPVWRYLPPTLPKHSTPLDPSAHPPNVTSVRSNDLSSDSPVSPTFDGGGIDSPRTNPQSLARSLIQNETAALTEVEHTPSIADTEACFENFKAKIARSKELGRQLLRDVFVSSCPQCENVWGYSALVVEYLLTLECDPTPIFATADNYQSFSIPPTYTSAHRSLLDSTQKISIAFPNRQQELHSLYLKLAQAAANAPTSTDSTQDAELVSLCKQLWKSAFSLGSGFFSSTPDLLCAVASKIQKNDTGAALYSMLVKTYGNSGPKHALIHLVSQAAMGRDKWLAAANFMDCVPRALLLDTIPMFTLYLSNALEGKIRVTASVHKQRWYTWLELLSHRREQGTVFLDAAINTIAKDVFDTVSKTANSRRSSDRSRPSTLLHALLFQMSEQYQYYAAAKVTMVQLIDSIAVAAQRGSYRTEDLLAGVLLSFKTESLPFSEIADAIAALLAQHGTTSSLLRFVTMLEHNKITLGETSVVDAMLRKRITGLQRQTGSLSNTQRQHHALTLHNCRIITGILDRIASVPDVKRKPIEAATFSSMQAERQFKHILDRADAARALPLQLQDISADISLEDRVALIHQLAHYYSLDNTRTHRECWRAIYYLYCHLRDHDLRIGPLFSRAVVRISIIRPLSENRFVSSQRLIWVCHIVARVEGVHVAKQIESDFWHWRGDVIQHTKRVHDSIGADRKEKARVGHMKKLGLI